MHLLKKWTALLPGIALSLLIAALSRWLEQLLPIHLIGAAVIAAGSELMRYKPSWGMLVGVRPSKVALEMLNHGMSKTRVKKTLSSDYFVTPKKAGLAVDVAKKEKEIMQI